MACDKAGCCWLEKESVKVLLIANCQLMQDNAFRSDLPEATTTTTRAKTTSSKRPKQGCKNNLGNRTKESEFL